MKKSLFGIEQSLTFELENETGADHEFFEKFKFLLWGGERYVTYKNFQPFFRYNR